MSGCDFRIGQKVVCVDAEPKFGWTHWPPGDDVPVVGAVYTISGIIDETGVHGIILLFREIRRGPYATQHPTDPVLGYGHFRFRPLDEHRYDISIFQEMCVKASRKLVSR